MIKHSLPALAAALVVCAPLAAMAQGELQPTPVAYPGDQPFPAPDEQTYTYAPPMMMLPPGAVWIAAHYTWDAARSNYAWVEGQYVLPPRPDAQWIEGHWIETPTSWIWLDGRWN